MKFEKVYEEIMTTVYSKEPKTVKDPSKYPKDNFYAWDPGITDRGITGFTSDINVLTQKETVGTSKDNTGITFKTEHDNPKRKKK
jgi:hypothetical protein